MIRLIYVLFALAMVLVACQNDEPPTGDVPDAMTSITAQDPNLGSSLVVRYPDDWTARTQGGFVVLANDPDVLNIVSATVMENDAEGEGDNISTTQIAAGQVYMDFLPLPRTFLEANWGLPPNATATDVLRTLFVRNQPSTEYSDIRVISLDGRDAVSVTGTRSGTIQPGRVQFYVTTQPDGFVGISAYTAEGEDSFDATIRTLAEQATATFTALDFPAESAPESTPETTPEP